MPVQPRFQSAKARERAVALVMAVVFCLAVGAAYGWTTLIGRHLTAPTLSQDTETSAGIRLRVPIGWRATGEPTGLGEIDSLQVFAAPGENGPKLQVASLMRPVPSIPEAALDPAMSVLLRPYARGRISVMRRMQKHRVGSMVGVSYSQLVTPDSQTAVYHTWATLTRDGRRHWVLHLSYPLPLQSIRDERLKLIDDLFDRIRQTAECDTDAPAEPSDFSRVGIDCGDRMPVIPPTLQAVVSWDNTTAIAITPTEEQIGLEVHRTRGTIDAGIDNPKHILSPDALISQWFLGIMGRPPHEDEIWTGELDGHKAWRVVLSPGEDMRHGSPLIRQLLYIRTHPGHAILIESLTEEARVTSITGRVDAIALALIAAIHDATPPPATTPATQPTTDPDFIFSASGLRAAIERGDQLAQQLRALAVEHHNGWTYRLAEQENRTTDYSFERRWTVTDQSTQYLVGIASTSATRGRWKSNVALSQYDIAAAQAAGHSMTSALPEEWVRLRDGRITASQHLKDKVADIWTMNAPPAFVPPMAGEFWPLADIAKWTSQPTIIWLANGLEPPTPCVVGPSLAPAPLPLPAPADEDDLSFSEMEAGSPISIRPLIAMDADVLTFDEAGRVMLEYRNINRFALTGPRRAVLRRVDRDELLQHVPALEAELERWENKDAPKP